MVMFFTFLFLLSLLPDMRRVFQYHGAEHKVVFNFESGKPVNVENAQKFVTFHPRCGTSFLFVVLGNRDDHLRASAHRWILDEVLSPALRCCR